MRRDPHCKPEGKKECGCEDDWTWKMTFTALIAALCVVALLATLVGGIVINSQKKRDLMERCLRGDTVAGQIARTPADCHNGVYGHSG